MRITHRTPDKALQICVDLQGRRLLTIHQEIVGLTEKHFEEPPARLHVEAQHRGLDPDVIWVLNPRETQRW